MYCHDYVHVILWSVGLLLVDFCKISMMHSVASMHKCVEMLQGVFSVTIDHSD